jgi:ketosteroid isomerase-like protein
MSALPQKSRRARFTHCLPPEDVTDSSRHWSCGILRGLMSQQNVELVKSAQPTDIDLVEIFPENEVSGQAAMRALPDVFEPDFTVRFIAGRGMELPEYRGIDGLAEAWRDWLAPWASYRLEAEEFIDAGEEVVVFVRAQGRTARDSVLVEHTAAAIWSIREGRVAAICFYLERDEALEAAGLSEQDVATPDSPTS